MINATLFDLRPLALLWLYVLPLALTQTWLLGFERRTWLSWVGLQLLLLFVCLGLVPLVPGLGLGVLLGAFFLLPVVALVVGLFWLSFRVWTRSVPWFAQQVLQGRIPNFKERLSLSLLGSWVVWWLFPLVSQSFPLGFRLGLLVVLGVAVGQVTGRYLRR